METHEIAQNLITSIRLRRYKIYQLAKNKDFLAASREEYELISWVLSCLTGCINHTDQIVFNDLTQVIIELNQLKNLSFPRSFE